LKRFKCLLIRAAAADDARRPEENQLPQRGDRDAMTGAPNLDEAVLLRASQFGLAKSFAILAMADGLNGLQLKA